MIKKKVYPKIALACGVSLFICLVGLVTLYFIGRRKMDRQIRVSNSLTMRALVESVLDSEATLENGLSEDEKNESRKIFQSMRFNMNKLDRGDVRDLDSSFTYYRHHRHMGSEELDVNEARKVIAVCKKVVDRHTTK